MENPLINDYFECVVSGEQERMLSLFTPNCVISFSKDIFSFSGILEGKDAFADYLAYLKAVIISVTYHMEKFSYITVNSTTTVVRGSEDISLTDGSTYRDKTIYSVFTFADNLIQSMHVYDEQNYLSNN